MIGQIDIVNARKYAEDKLKDKFSLRDFHYQVNVTAVSVNPSVVQPVLAFGSASVARVGIGTIKGPFIFYGVGEGGGGLVGFGGV